jgi:cell division protein FtsQ
MRRLGAKAQAIAVNRRPRRTTARTRTKRFRTRAGVVISCVSILFLIATAGGVWTVRTGALGEAVGLLKVTMVAVTIRAGLTVDDVLVAGRRETKRSDLLSAIDAQRGDPIIVFDPTAARQRVMNLGWVADAKVERRLPNTIYVRLSERSPVAVWQRNGEFSLVDAEGVVIGESSAGQRRDLTLIVGAEAPRHASTLLVMLDTQPQLMERVVAAVRVADRRWNLRLNNGIDVRLPEINPQAAWDHLAELEAEHKLLERDIILIDLRLPERLVVRMRPLEGRRPRAPGEHT